MTVHPANSDFATSACFAAEYSNALGGVFDLSLRKADRVRYLGFDDRPLVVLGLLPLAALSNAFFDGWNPVLTPRQMLSCYALSTLFTTIY